MNSARYINSVLKKEKNVFLFKKPSEPGLLDNTIIGFLYYILNKDKDYFLITNKRIVCLVKNKLIINSEYNAFSGIQFNSSNDTIKFENIENKQHIFSLRDFRLTYEEIQRIKKVLS